MRKFTTTYIIAIILTAVACDKQQPSGAFSDKLIGFNAGDSTLPAVVDTKAGEVKSLSSFDVNCVTGTMGSAETSVFNCTFSGSPAVGGQYWPVTDPGYGFYASNVAMTPSSSGPKVTADCSTDVVCAVLADPEFGSVNDLVFEHVLSRLGKCVITLDEGVTPVTVIAEITPRVSGTYSLWKGNGRTDGTGWSNVSEGEPVTIAFAANSTRNNNLWLLPGEYDITVMAVLLSDGMYYSLEKHATVSLMAGKVNNLSARLSLSDSVYGMEFTVTVESWRENSMTGTFN